VFDPYTFALRQEATPLGGTWTATDVQAVDVDGDGDLELAILNSFLELIDWRQGAPVSTRRFYSGSRLLRVADLDGDGALELAIAGTNGVGAQRLTDGSSLWYQTTGFVPERLVVADVDRDGRAELLACGNNSSVRVFDAATGASEATLAGPWSAVDAPLLAPGFALLAVGDRQGRLGLFVPGSGSYGLVGPVPFTTAPVRGVDFLDGTALLVLSSPAGVAIHDGLWPLWRSTPIGTASSRRPVVHWPSLQLFASSEVGLFAFRPR
jgi:hypothetical protein